jgi:hypothetical protein
MHLLPERIFKCIFCLNSSFSGGWWSGFPEKGSQGLSVGTNVATVAKRFLVFTSVVYASIYPGPLAFLVHRFPPTLFWDLPGSFDVLEAWLHPPTHFRVSSGSLTSLLSAWAAALEMRKGWRTVTLRRVEICTLVDAGGGPIILGVDLLARATNTWPARDVMIHALPLFSC